MNYLDLIILLILLYSIYSGYRRGLVWQLIMLAALLLGVFIAIRTCDLTGNMINKIFVINPNRLRLAAFVINLVLLLIVSHLLGYVVTKILDTGPLGLANRILGAVFSTLKAVVLMSVLIFIINKFNFNMEFLSKEKTDNSLLYKPLSIFAPSLFPYLKTGITKTVEFNRQNKINE